MNKITKNLIKRAKQIRQEVLKMSYHSHAAHIGSSLSIVDILTVLYFHTLKINPKKPRLKTRDRFLLSKGHASSTLYAALALKGFFSKKLLATFCQNETKLGVHPEIHSLSGIEISSGSLGHGLALGVGMTIAGKVDQLPYRVFVLMSDGECDEGTVWEAALSAAQFKLDNLVAIIDYNKFQALGKTNKIMNLEPLADKWTSFGWSVKEIDGHNISQLLETFNNIPFTKNKPTAIIAHTIKGKGVSFMENQFVWHYNNLDEQSYQKALNEL